MCIEDSMCVLVWNQARAKAFTRTEETEDTEEGSIMARAISVLAVHLVRLFCLSLVASFMSLKVGLR
jgi:hypothetical protein